MEGFSETGIQPGNCPFAQLQVVGSAIGSSPSDEPFALLALVYSLGDDGVCLGVGGPTR